VERLVPFRVEPCACGGLIRVYANDPGGIPAAVARHNLTARHREWRALGGLSMERDAELFGRVAA
jgi:hypothetical protein